MSSLPESQSAGQKAFDAHHPPSMALIDECVHCGFCLPHCPTYSLWHEEMDSPRGRIYLMKLAADGKIAMTDKFVQHMDQCLGCMACETACPSGVQYGKLIESTRSQIERRHPRPVADRLLRRMLFSVFPYPGRLRVAAAILWFYQNSGVQWLARKTGLLGLLPVSARTMESTAPIIGSGAMTSRTSAFVPAEGKSRRKVGLLLGCVQRVFFHEVNAATVRVLAAEGCDVIVPASQGCCGALMVHAGEEEQALGFARRLIDSFESAGVDVIVINAAGCGSTMKEYGYLLQDDPKYAEKARAFSSKCKDISEVLAELEPVAPRKPMPIRVAYQDACHLQHAQRIVAQPRLALKTIPGVEIIESREPGMCCGSAGIYNLVEPAAAVELGDRKARAITDTHADVMASGNPGCLLQLSAGLGRAGTQMPVVHFIQLIDASIRGVPLPGVNPK